MELCSFLPARIQAGWASVGRGSAVEDCTVKLTLILGAVAALALLGAEPSQLAVAPQAKAPGTIRPAPPSRYTVPRPFVLVRTSSELRAALERRSPTTIVLRRGTYDADRAFVNAYGHRLYAGSLGKAVLTAGLRLGIDDERPGGLVRGVVFDVRDHAKTVDGVTLLVLSPGVRVLDVSLRGHGIIRSGLIVREPEGFWGTRLVVRDFTDYGVLVDANNRDRTSLARPFELRDLDVAGIKRPVPGSSQGRGEACVWVGNPGVVQRVRARRCGWTGLWTGTAATNGRFTGIDVDETRTGVYLEHFTRQSTFERVRVGRRVRVGLIAEWADPDSGGVPGSIDNVIQDSRFESWLAGVYLDEGTTRTVIRRSTFVGQRWAAIGDYEGVDNAYLANDYRGIARGAVPVTREHIRTATEAGG